MMAAGQVSFFETRGGSFCGATFDGPWAARQSLALNDVSLDTTLSARRTSPGHQLRHCIGTYARAAAVPVGVWAPHIAPLAVPSMGILPISNGCRRDASYKPPHSLQPSHTTPQTPRSCQPAPSPPHFQRPGFGPRRPCWRPHSFSRRLSPPLERNRYDVPALVSFA